MSNGYRWELLEGENGVVFLSYWDTMHGNDVVLTINPDGTIIESAYEEDEDGEAVYDSHGELIDRPVPVPDLIERFRQFLKERPALDLD